MSGVRGQSLWPCLLVHVDADLADGEPRLRAGRKLDLPDVASFDYPLDAIYRVDTPPGPAASWLIERFRGQSPDQDQS